MQPKKMLYDFEKSGLTRVRVDIDLKRFEPLSDASGLRESLDEEIQRLGLQVRTERDLEGRLWLVRN